MLSLGWRRMLASLNASSKVGLHWIDSAARLMPPARCAAHSFNSATRCQQTPTCTSTPLPRKETPPARVARTSVPRNTSPSVAPGVKGLNDFNAPSDVFDLQAIEAPTRTSNHAFCAGGSQSPPNCPRLRRSKFLLRCKPRCHSNPGSSPPKTGEVRHHKNDH